MLYIKKYITCSALIACVFFTQSSIAIDKVSINDTPENKTIFQTKINSKETGLATSIKISPLRSSNRVNNELNKSAFTEQKTEQEKTDAESDEIQTATKVKVIQKNGPQFIEGYKVDHTGKNLNYVYGNIHGNENGEIYGYLYENSGPPVYFYGRNTDDGRKSIYAKDRQSGIYILYRQQTTNEIVDKK